MITNQFSQLMVFTSCSFFPSFLPQYLFPEFFLPNAIFIEDDLLRAYSGEPSTVAENMLISVRGVGGLAINSDPLGI